MHLNWLANTKLSGPSLINNIFIYCCMRVLFYAKMLKETEIEKTKGFFVIFFSLREFQFGGPGPSAPLWLRLSLEAPLIFAKLWLLACIGSQSVFCKAEKKRYN